MPKGVKKTKAEDFEPAVELDEKGIVGKIMSEKEVTKEDEAKTKVLSANADEKEMEAIRNQTDPHGRFIVVQVMNGGYRVMNKRRQWVTPVTTLNIASRTCTSFNMKDPEQRKVNQPQMKAQGMWYE